MAPADESNGSNTSQNHAQEIITGQVQARDQGSPGHKEEKGSFNFFIVKTTGVTGGAHETFIRKLEHKGQTKKESVEESDYILVFCPLHSRTGTDVEEAMKKIPSGKPVILVVMHHRHDLEAPLGDSSRHVSREDVILTVDTLFWEGEFLKCSYNKEAFSKVKRKVGHSPKKLSLARLKLGFTDHQDTKKKKGSFNFFVVVTGVTGGAHETFIRQLKGQKKKESVEESDYILAFCPLPSRTGTDVTEAMRKIPNGKPVILVVMHHRHDVKAPLGDSSRHVSRDDVILTVDTLFWEGEFLKCSYNKKAFSEVKRTVGHLPKKPSKVPSAPGSKGGGRKNTTHLEGATLESRVVEQGLTNQTTAQHSPSYSCLIL